MIALHLRTLKSRAGSFVPSILSGHQNKSDKYIFMTQQCTKRASSEKITDFRAIKNKFFYCGRERDVSNLPWKRNFMIYYYLKVSLHYPVNRPFHRYRGHLELLRFKE